MEQPVCRVRAEREARGLRAAELAERAGLTRQGLHKIESGGAVPNTLVALRLAAALGCSVEALFALPQEQRARSPETTEPGARVQLAAVGGVLHAYPLGGAEGLSHPADGVVTAREGDLLRVRPFAPRPDLSGAVVAGCDPSLGLAAQRATAAGARVLWRPASSGTALEWLAAGAAHAAGIHLFDAPSGQSNLPFVRAALPEARARLFTLWSWEQGLIVAPGNPLGLRGPADLGRPGLRLVNREPGAGSRHLLDAWLAAAGLAGADLPGYDRTLGSHTEVAASVARGEANAGPGPRSAARALGLDFLPVQRERFDLVVPEAHLDHPGLRALLGVLGREDFQQELPSLGGYDPQGCGSLWQIAT